MSLHMLSEERLRTGCKQAIEALELWLRRAIEIALVPDFGNDYLNSQINGQYVFKKEVRCRISMRRQKSPEKFPRLMDAALLEDEIYVVCHPTLYNDYFRRFFESSWPHAARDQVRFFLMRLVDPRNSLMHSNPISVRQAEQVLCYSYDAIESIKTHLEELNMGQDYNAPRIVRLADSSGQSFSNSQISRNTTGRGHVNVNESRSGRLRVGDMLSIEAEVDPSFASDRYRIGWVYPNPAPEHQNYEGNRISIELLECHVREDFTVYCQVTSTDQSWHRCGDVDDSVGLTYKILPPL